MNTSNSNRLALMVLGLVVVATTAANAQQQRFAPPTQSTQHARLGIQTTFQQVGIKNGTVATFGERINYVRPGSPAARTGLEAGDTIVGYYLGNDYRKIFRRTDLKYAISASRGRLRIKVINYRNGQYVDVSINSYSGNGGYDGGNGNGGNGNGGNGNGTAGPNVVDHRQPTMAPPAPQFQIPAARAGYVWIRGHYEWRSGAYAWIRGHWEGARADNAAWTPGYWSAEGNCWVWTAGHWTKVGPTVKVTRR